MSEKVDKSERLLLPDKEVKIQAIPVKDPLPTLSKIVETLLEIDNRLSLQSMVVLIELGQNKVLSQHELADLTRIRQSTLSRLLSHLGKGKPEQLGLGLVLSKVDEYNQRSKLFYLSAKGESIVNRWRALIAK